MSKPLTIKENSNHSESKIAFEAININQSKMFLLECFEVVSLYSTKRNYLA